MDAYKKYATPRGVVKYPPNGYVQQPCDNHKITVSTRKNNPSESYPSHNTRNCHVDRDNTNIYEENAMLRKEREVLINKCRYLQELSDQLKEELECEKKSSSSFRRKSDMLEKELDTATKTLYTVKQLQESEGRLQCQVEVLLTENKKLKLKESEYLTEIRQLKNEKDVMVMDYQRYAKQLHQIFNCKLEKKDKLCQEYQSKLKEILEANKQLSSQDKDAGEAVQVILPQETRNGPHDIPRLKLSSSSTDLFHLNCGVDQDFSSGTDSLIKEDEETTDEETLEKVSTTNLKPLIKVESPSSSHESSISQKIESLSFNYIEKDNPNNDITEPVIDSFEGTLNHATLNTPSAITDIDKGESLKCFENEDENLTVPAYDRLKGGAVMEEAAVNYTECNKENEDLSSLTVDNVENYLPPIVPSDNENLTDVLLIDPSDKTERKSSHEELVEANDDDLSLDHEASAEIIDILRGVNSPSPSFPLSEGGDGNKVVEDFLIASKGIHQITFDDEDSRSPDENKVNEFESAIIAIGIPKPLKSCLSSQSLHRASSVIQPPVKRTRSFTSMDLSPWLQEVSTINVDSSTNCSLLTNPNSVWKRYTLMKNVMPAGHLKKTLDVLSFK